MSNLLSAELYKLRKDLNFRIMAALAVILTVAQYGINAILENTLRASGEQADRMEALARIGILDMLHNMFSNTNAIIFVTIFVCCFVLNEYSSGMTANFVGKGYKRAKVFFAKFLVAELGAVLLYLLTALTTFFAGIFFRGTGEINVAFFYDFGVFFTLHILYLTAYNAVIILICTLTGNMAAGILVSVLGIMLLSNVMAQGIDFALSYMGIQTGVSQYWIGAIIASCPVRDIPSRFIMVSGIATVFWLAASLAAGMVWFEKRDIR